MTSGSAAARTPRVENYVRTYLNHCQTHRYNVRDVFTARSGTRLASRRRRAPRPASPPGPPSLLPHVQHAFSLHARSNSQTAWGSTADWTRWVGRAAFASCPTAAQLRTKADAAPARNGDVERGRLRDEVGRRRVPCRNLEQVSHARVHVLSAPSSAQRSFSYRSHPTGTRHWSSGTRFQSQPTALRSSVLGNLTPFSMA